MSRITQKITYNLAERGRTHTGIDRSNIDIRSMVDAINSSVTQELVATGDLYGFYGHEVRALYGMNPPDSIHTEDGREIRIAPAIRTVELSADNQGNVTHREEFLENEAGEYAYQQYKAKIGGFSTAVLFQPQANGSRIVSGFYGFDYVRNPNYATNTSYGLFDSLNHWQADPIKLQLRQTLEQSLITQYDSIHSALQSQAMMDYYQQQALASQQALTQNTIRREKIQQRKQAKQQAMIDSLICPAVPFEEYLQQIKAFDALQIDQNMFSDKSNEVDPQPKNTVFQALLGRGRVW